MKVCAYCESEITDNEKRCANCGSTEYNQVCSNCSTHYKGMVCPECGILKDESPRTCFHCGKKTFEKVCPDCGSYLIQQGQTENDKKNISNNINDVDENITINIRNEDFNESISININGISQFENTNFKEQSSKQNDRSLYKEKLKKQSYKSFNEEKFKNPIDKSENNRNKFSFKGNLKKNRWVILIIGILSFFIFLLVLPQENSVPTKTTTDLEMLTLPGHPKYFDTLKETRKYYKGNKKALVTAASNSSNQKLLVMKFSTPWSLEEDKLEIIEYITINFTKYTDANANKLSLEDILKILCGYIPFELVDKYYTFNESFHEVIPYEDRDHYEAYHYILHLNNAGRKANEENKNLYNDEMYIRIYHSVGKSNWTAEISPTGYNWNHDKFPVGYVNSDLEDWNVNINDYRVN